MSARTTRVLGLCQPGDGLRAASRAYRRVVGGGAAITTDSPATDLHALRRRCKETSPPKGPQDCRGCASSIQSPDDPCVSETRISPGDIARLLHEAKTSEVPRCVWPSQRHIHRAVLARSSPVRPTLGNPASLGDMRFTGVASPSSCPMFPQRVPMRIGLQGQQSRIHPVWLCGSWFDLVPWLSRHGPWPRT